jgi:PadR family transcriptional regulator PadR
MKIHNTMPTAKTEKDRLALLQGTLDLLILRTLVLGSNHGQGIARAIQQQAEDTLLVDHGSLYPALQRLEDRGWISGEWGISDKNRRARFYTLTQKGRKHLVAETRQWWRLAAAVGRILGPEEAWAMFWRKRRRSDDFRQEVEAHIAAETERMAGEGLSPAEARAAALRAFGNRVHAEERFYESHRVMWLHNAFRDLRYAFSHAIPESGFLCYCPSYAGNRHDYW